MTGPTGRTREQSALQVNRENPWPGLAAFSEEHAEFFHGREREVEELFRRVRFNALSVLYGQSGLGKTSLVQAALFPRLRGVGVLPVSIRIDYSTGALAARLQICQAISKAVHAAGGVAQQLGEQESLWEYFHRERPAAADASGKPLIIALAFDQFEEAFTLGSDRRDGRGFVRDLVEELGALAEHRPPSRVESAFERDPELVADFDFDRQDYRILLSLREDFLAHLHDLAERIPSITVNNMRLPPLDGSRALEVIERPGKEIVAPGAAEAIVRFVADAGDERRDNAPRREGDTGQKHSARPIESLEVDPSLLSLFCRELNEKRGAGLITPLLVTASREKILAEFYERALADQHPGVRLFVEEDLLTAKGFRQTLRADSAEEKLREYGAPAEAVTTLVNRRLLHYEQRGRDTRVELTHDVLTRVVRESRNERQAKEAEEAKRRDAEEAERRADAARAATEAELVQVRKRSRATRALLGIVGIAAAAAIWFAVQAGRSQRIAVASADSLSANQKALRDSTLAAQTARAQADSARRRADSALVAADSARTEAVDALAAVNAERATSDSMMVDFCTYGLTVINRFGDSTTNRPELTRAYNSLIEISESSVESMLKRRPEDPCPRRLDARTESVALGLQYDLNNRDSVAPMGYRALRATRQLARFTDSLSRQVAAQSYYDITYQLWRVDANDSAAAAAREGVRIAAAVDPRRDSAAYNRRARTFHFGSRSILDIARADTATQRRRSLLVEAGEMADSGLAIVQRGLARKEKDQNPKNLLFTQTQLWIDRGEVDTARYDTTRAMVGFRRAAAAAQELHTVQNDWGSHRYRATVHASLGNFAVRLRQFAEGSAAHDSAIAGWGGYLANYRRLGNQTEMELAYDGIATGLLGKARAARGLGRTARVIFLAQEAVDSAEAGFKGRYSPTGRRYRANAYNGAGDVLDAIPRRELADSFYRTRLRLDSTALRDTANLVNVRNLELGLAAGVFVLQRRAREDTAGKPAADAARILRSYEERQRPYRDGQLSLRRLVLERIPRGLNPGPDSVRRHQVLRDSVAESLGSLAWTELMLQRPEQAVEHMRESFRLLGDSIRVSSRHSFILPNFFNGLLLMGRDEAATAYFRANATRRVEAPPVPFPCAVVRDIRNLRFRGAATDRHVQVVERLVAPYIKECRLPKLPTS